MNNCELVNDCAREAHFTRVREQLEFGTTRDENRSRAILRTFDDNSRDCIWYSASFLSTRNIQNYHFLENELVPEILGDAPLSIRRNLWIQLGDASHCAVMVKSALFMKMDRSKRMNFLVSMVTRPHTIGFHL